VPRCVLLCCQCLCMCVCVLLRLRIIAIIKLHFLLIYQRLSSVSRTHIETGIYFRWDDPDDDSAASSLSLLNDARLGSYVYDDRPAGVDDSSTDGNNNQLNSSLDGRRSPSQQHVTASTVTVQNDQTLVS